MSEYLFLFHVSGALLAALAGGIVARALRFPVMVGYLVAGIIIGPHTPGFIADDATVKAIANIGIVLFMFAIGVQFSLKEMRAVQRTALLGGGLQVLGTILLGMGLGWALGWGVYGGLFLGCALSLSSTGVMMRILEERGELGAVHGSLMLGVSVVQDLSLVLMAALLSALGPTDNATAPIWIAVGWSLLKAVLFVAGTLLLALRGVPSLMERIAATGSRELFLLTVVCLGLLAAVAAEIMGLGVAMGAFIAGIIVSESPYSDEIFTQIRPLRDVFASIFFVSVGMLLDPSFVLSHLLPVTLVVTAILIWKAIISMLAIYPFGWDGRSVFLAGIGLAQIGEFSFVLATLGTGWGVIPDEIAATILSSALITLLIAPFWYQAADPFYKRLSAIPIMANLLNRPARTVRAETGEPPIELRNHVVVLGCGRVGRYILESLAEKGIPHIGVDYDTHAMAWLKDNAIPNIYGDATSPIVLEKAMVRHARLVMLALPEAVSTELTIRAIREVTPHAPIVARVHLRQDILRMRAIGADVVIQAEFEASLEMIRQGLHRLNFPIQDVDGYIDHLRGRKIYPGHVPEFS